MEAYLTLILDDRGRWVEQIIDRPAVHEVGADQSGKDDRTLDVFLSGLSQAQQQEGDKCDSNLDAYGILGGANEAGDLEGQFDPAEEQLDGPTSAVEIGNLLCAGIEIIRQDAQHGSAIGRDPHLPHRVLHRIATALGLACGEEADAVGEDAAAPGDRQFFHHVERCVGFKAGDDPAAGSVEGRPPTIVVITESNT
jgi:hypothetical protein